MTKISIPREIHPGETRAPLLPDDVKRLVTLGAEVVVEAGLGTTIPVADDDYRGAGAEVLDDRRALLSAADVILRIRKPPLEEIPLLKAGAVHISFLDPLNEPDLVAALAAQKVSAISMEFLPRTTRAQKMDIISSQASLGGYVAVILAAMRLPQVFPMMMTPAGTLAPARVFVIGAGVAGLQAIATAKRLGARVEAFDTRPVVAEQVQSLGGRFIKIDLGETGQDKNGYAKPLTTEQLELQRREMAKVCAYSDVVITTAQVFGRKAPLLLTREMVTGMKPGSVVIDMAAESGGNVDGSVVDQEVELQGVRVVGLANLPGRVARHASQMVGSNLTSLVEEFWDNESATVILDVADEILAGCLITHDGAIVNERVKGNK